MPPELEPNPELAGAAQFEAPVTGARPKIESSEVGKEIEVSGAATVYEEGPVFSAAWPPEAGPVPPEAQREDGDKATEEKEKGRESLSEEIFKTFPELKNDAAKGEVVQSILLELLDVKHIGSVKELRRAVPGGFVFVEEDIFIPAELLPEDAKDQKIPQVAGGREGWVYLYPVFFTDAVSPEDRAHALGHEMGEVMQRLVVQTEVGEGSDKKTVEQPLFDINAYHALIDPAVRLKEWNSPYIQIFAGQKGYPREALADDISRYLRSDRPEGWAMLLIDQMDESKKSELKLQLEDGQSIHDPNTEIAQLMEYATRVYTFLDKEYSGKKQNIKKPEYHYDSGGSLVGGGGYEHVSLNTGHTNVNIMKWIFDRLFGVPL